MAAITGWTRYIKSGQDARRKSDLSKIKVALEDYYNDHQRYPPSLDCGQNLSPYLKAVPCDPETKLRYEYETVSDNSNYKIYAILKDTSDPAITQSGCTYGCLCSGSCKCNYAVTSPNTYVQGCAFNDWYVCTGSEPGRQRCNLATGSNQCGPEKLGCYSYGCPGSPCPDPGY